MGVVQRADHAAGQQPRRRPRVTRAIVTRAREAAFAELAALADRAEDEGAGGLVVDPSDEAEGLR
jgi:hypothetical protein